jgi:hypothetical protein
VSARRKPMVKDRRVALWGGVAAIFLGSFLLYDAYECRGRPRPFAARLLPGP